MHRTKIIICVMAVFLALGIAGVIIFNSETYKQVKNDFERLETEEYDTVFFSMYPTDYYQAEDYALFRAMDIVRTDYDITNGRMLQLYINKMKVSGNGVTTVYLGIRPEKVSAKDVTKIVQENPDVTFEITLAHPCIDFWIDKSEKDTEKIIERYKELAESLLTLPNARVYFFGSQEWLICNSANYEDSFLTNPEVSRFLLANTDMLHPYMLSEASFEAQFAGMFDLIRRQRENPIQYPNGSNMDIVFLGDSIIGNYTDSLSVPEVVKALTGARVYNCGYGGRSAALGEKDDLSVSMIVEGIIQGDISGFPTESQVYLGSKEFLECQDTNRNLMFVIHYGFNDYSKGYPVKTENVEDEYSYSGAMRLAVQKIKEAYPEAGILIMVPGFASFFDCGEQIMGQGSKLEAYRVAARDLARELDVDCLDLAEQMPTNTENWSLYLADDVHFNERGRYMVGQLISLEIQ